MKKFKMLAAVIAVSLVSVVSHATANCAHGKKDALFAKRDWSALKAGSTAKPVASKAVATKTGTVRKAVK